MGALRKVYIKKISKTHVFYLRLYELNTSKSQFSHTSLGGDTTIVFKRTNTRVHLSLEAYILSVQFFSSYAHPTGCTQLPLARYRLHCILKNGMGNKRQFHCLRFLRSSRQMDCARKSRQLNDLYVLIKSLIVI